MPPSPPLDCEESCLRASLGCLFAADLAITASLLALRAVACIASQRMEA